MSGRPPLPLAIVAVALPAVAVGGALLLEGLSTADAVSQTAAEVGRDPY